MKYYSDKTKKLYDSIDALEKAEIELSKREAEEKKKRDERALRAKEVAEAHSKYEKLLKEFIKDYGAYHYSITDADSLFDYLFNKFPF